jgi:two-component system sensor histidine kinase ChiS
MRARLRPCRSVGAVAAALAAGLSLAFAAASAANAATVDCVRQHAGHALPEPALCLRRAGVPSTHAPDVAARALFAQAERQLAAGRFGEASQALDCVDAVVGVDGDGDARYELTRRRGILDYRSERIPQALSRFQCALQASTAAGDRIAMARDLKNVGASLRRLGDFHGALRALSRSLQINRDAGREDGAVSNNIGDVYRDLQDPVEAMRHYQQARVAFQRAGKPTEAAHVLEAMGETSLDQGDARDAAQRLEEVLQVYHARGERRYELRVYAGLMRAALAMGDVPGARRRAASALAVSTEHGLPLPAPLQLQIARTERLSGHPDAAVARLRGAIALLADGDVDRAGLLDELAASQEATGDPAAAVATLRLANADTLARTRAEHDRDLGWLRMRFETAERDRTIAHLEAQNQRREAALQRRTLWLWLTAAIALILVLSVTLVFLHRQQRARLLDAERRARHDEELARYRREADALAQDRSMLQALLDSRADAVCLLDDEGQVLAANQAACRLLGATDASPVGRSLAAFCGDEDRSEVAAALQRMEDAEAQTVAFERHDGAMRLSAQLAQWAHGDGVIAMALQESPGDAPEPPRASTGVPDVRFDDAGLRDAFRMSLVALMLAVVDAWEQATGSGRLELAEKSRIWRVYIDDGRLRARTMERYLSLSKLPRNPRWRDVLRSAYFVLGQCALDEPVRADLQARLDAVLGHARRSALM